MASINAPVTPVSPRSCCYRLTAKGRACVNTVEFEVQTIGSLSPYLHDVLVLCGEGVWFQQLQQFMPPRSLEESLRSLQALGLIEVMDPREAPGYAPPVGHRAARVSDF